MRKQRNSQNGIPAERVSPRKYGLRRIAFEDDRLLTCTKKARGRFVCSHRHCDISEWTRDDKKIIIDVQHDPVATSRPDSRITISSTFSFPSIRLSEHCYHDLRIMEGSSLFILSLF